MKVGTQKIYVFDLKKYISCDALKDLDTYLKQLNFRKNVPGGMLKYSPNRLYNMKGDGRGIDQNGNFVGSPIESTFYTASKNASNITLESKTEPIPSQFIPIIQFARNKFKTKMNGTVSDYTFNMGVCNRYEESNMTISPHTDDNEWYKTECDYGPVFASLTVYPEKKPRSNDELANFEIRPDLKQPWQKVLLPHMSLCIMPASILHRVRASKPAKFCKRINITFRSAFSPQENPLMHLMSLSNHTRYYGCPKKLYVPRSVALERRNEIQKYYNKEFDVPVTLIDAVNKKDLIKSFKSITGYTGKMKAIYTARTIEKAIEIYTENQNHTSNDENMDENWKNHKNRKKRKIVDYLGKQGYECNCPIYLPCNCNKRLKL